MVLENAILGKGIVSHAFNPSSQEAERVDCSEFEVRSIG